MPSTEAGPMFPIDCKGFHLYNRLVMLDQRERVVEMVEEGAPFLVASSLSKADRVVISMLPLNKQHVVARGFDRT